MEPSILLSPSAQPAREGVWLPVGLAGKALLRVSQAIQGLGAFTLITLGVLFTKSHVAPGVIRPLIRGQIYEAGLRLLPMVTFAGMALGLVIIGQMVSLLTRVGAQEYTGMIMVTVVVRELGPLAAAMLVLARVGTATVIELGTARALGEVEGLESIGIDPIHYLVVPRILGLSISIFANTIYLILVALISGYLFAFVQEVAIRPSDYFFQLAIALRWEDFVLLALKTACFGALIAITTCFQGLARPLRLDEVSGAATRAVVHSVVACVCADALFILIYLVTM